MNHPEMPDSSNPSESPNSSALAYLHSLDAEVRFRNDGHVYIEARRTQDGLRVQASGRGLAAAVEELKRWMTA